MFNFLKAWLGMESELIKINQLNQGKYDKDEIVKNALECYMIHEELQCNKYCDKYLEVKNNGELIKNDN